MRITPAWRRAVLGLILAAPLLVPVHASAFTAHPLWKCRASALYTSVAGNNRIEPVVANGNPSTANNKSPDRAQCANEEAGADNLATPLGVPTTVIGAQTASAKTTIDPETGLAIDQKVNATSRVENLSLPLGGTNVVLGVAAANSTVTGGCANGSPQLTATSQMAGLTLGGTPVPLDGLLGALQQALAPLSPVIDVKFNEQVKTATGLAVRAAHIKILSAAGTPLADIVIAESNVDTEADTCNPNKQIPGFDGQICPTGSTLDTMTGFCVIPASANNQLIVVGRPFEGPSGGTVVPINVALKKYPSSVCLKSPGGKKYAVLGTNGKDRITGTNQRDLILSLGGNDSVAAGRGADCIEGGDGNDRLDGGIGSDRMLGGKGNDTMTGDLDKDRMDGGAGNDKVNGGSGADTLTGGTGNDIISSGYGADKVDAGSGNDAVNIATQGPAARANCGKGKDKIRLNNKEKRRIKGCEIRYVLKDK